MHLVRFTTSAAPSADTPAVRVGVLVGGRVHPVAGVRRIADLLALRAAELRSVLEAAAAAEEGAVPAAEAVLLPPVDGRTEVWASGVTYERSRAARMEESSEADVYDRVHTAARPELFFKSAAWRAVTDGEPIGIREDSALNVPEPELALILNAFGETVGYTVCNDVSSRTIEGENPLYLPQAKVYAGACALAHGIRPWWEVADPAALKIELTVRRDGAPAFAGTTSTSRIRRPLAELGEYLFRGEDFPAGALLATGTGIVPELDFTLRPGDTVEISVEQVGSLTNPVTAGKDAVRKVLEQRPAE